MTDIILQRDDDLAQRAVGNIETRTYICYIDAANYFTRERGGVGIFSGYTLERALAVPSSAD